MTGCAFCGDTADIENGLCLAHVSELWNGLSGLDTDKSNAHYSPERYGNEFDRWFWRSRKAKPFRDPLVFYSTGHGWRLRKNPHWSKTFSDLYPFAWELLTKSPEQITTRK